MKEVPTGVKSEMEKLMTEKREKEKKLAQVEAAL